MTTTTEPISYMVINLCDHPVVVNLPGGESVTFKPSGCEARVKHHRETVIYLLGAIPVYKTVHEELQFLGKPLHRNVNAIYIVSKFCLEAIKMGVEIPVGLKRSQFVASNTFGPGCDREGGHVKSVRTFIG